MLNIADSMSTIEWFAEFEDDIESGLFEVRRGWRIIQVAGAFHWGELENLGLSAGEPIDDFRFGT